MILEPCPPLDRGRIACLTYLHVSCQILFSLPMHELQKNTAPAAPKPSNGIAAMVRRGGIGHDNGASGGGVTGAA
jgi:hypothetical protein